MESSSASVLKPVFGQNHSHKNQFPKATSYKYIFYANFFCSFWQNPTDFFLVETDFFYCSLELWTDNLLVFISMWMRRKIMDIKKTPGPLAIINSLTCDWPIGCCFVPFPNISLNEEQICWQPCFVGSSGIYIQPVSSMVPDQTHPAHRIPPLLMWQFIL